MLYNEGPGREVLHVVEIRDRNLDTPVLLIVHLHMPVNSNRAHMVRALKKGAVVFPGCVSHWQLKNSGIATASTKYISSLRFSVKNHNLGDSGV